VRRILRAPADNGAETPACDEATLDRLKAAFERGRGNVVRVRELLADDGLEVSYSTLTRWVREADLRGPPRRAGEYNFVPGQEMQHDTSPHRVTFVPADKPVTVQCAGLVLAYSRQLFIQYYPRFTRYAEPAVMRSVLVGIEVGQCTGDEDAPHIYVVKPQTRTSSLAPGLHRAAMR
jgi:hypothetical protein